LKFLKGIKSQHPIQACPLQPKIPHWLYWSGVLGLVIILITILRKNLIAHYNKVNGCAAKLLNVILGVLGFVALIWFFIGIFKMDFNISFFN
jgi:uncharacterized membrane protein YdcZ (DUF606 family)